MPPIPPFWFNQRQAKAQPAGDDLYRLTAPNLPEAFITVRRGDNGCWSGVLRSSADGPDAAATEAIYNNLADAWNAAFELYRNRVVV